MSKGDQDQAPVALVPVKLCSALTSTRWKAAVASACINYNSTSQQSLHSHQFKPKRATLYPVTQLYQRYQLYIQLYPTTSTQSPPPTAPSSSTSKVRVGEKPTVPIRAATAQSSRNLERSATARVRRTARWFWEAEEFRVLVGWKGGPFPLYQEGEGSVTGVFRKWFLVRMRRIRGSRGSSMFTQTKWREVMVLWRRIVEIHVSDGCARGLSQLKHRRIRVATL